MKYFSLAIVVLNLAFSDSFIPATSIGRTKVVSTKKALPKKAKFVAPKKKVAIKAKKVLIAKKAAPKKITKAPVKKKIVLKAKKITPVKKKVVLKARKITPVKKKVVVKARIINPIKKVVSKPVKKKAVKKAVPVVAKGKSFDVINPVDYLSRVVSTNKGKEAIGILINGGLLLAEAALDVGKSYKVEIPSGFDRDGNLIKKETFVGVKQLVDTGLFAGQELLGTALGTYDKLFVYKAPKSAKLGSFIKTEAAVKSSTGKVIKAKKEFYFVNVGGTRVKVQN